MQITLLDSNEQILSEIGRRIRAARIEANLTQEALAIRAGVSLSTVASIERGGEARLGSYLSILRSLGLLGNADMLVPETSVRPSQLAELGHERKRVRARKSQDYELASWKWGDER